MKGTAIFGGVQIFNIIINLLRGKFIAIFLGSVGMGVSGLFISTMNILIQLSLLGLNFSVVREIAQAQSDKLAQQNVICIFRRLLIILSIVGAIITIFGASRLSLWTFGNNDYIWSFRLLAVMLFFTVLSNGETAILQGTRKLKELAGATAIGATIGLLIGTPLYYWLGSTGIVPAMVILAISLFLALKYHTYKLKLVERKNISIKQTLQGGREMIGLGIAQMVSILFGMIGIYLVNTYISHSNCIEDVGLFQAASSITNQYIGFVFSAMAVDYYPRLAAVAEDKIKSRRMINNQSEVILLISVPIILILLITAPLIIRILLTEEFLPVIDVLRWMGLGLLFKVVSFPLGYISYAKGDKYTFFWLEGVYGNILITGCNILGYTFAGLQGLGVSFVTAYLLYMISVIIVTRIRYGFRFNAKVLQLIPVSVVLSIAVFLLFLLTDQWWTYVCAICLLGFSLVYSYCEIDKRVSIRAYIRNKLQKS